MVFLLFIGLVFSGKCHLMNCLPIPLYIIEFFSGRASEEENSSKFMTSYEKKSGLLKE